MRNKIIRMIANKLGIPSENIVIDAVDIHFSYIDPMTLSLKPGKKTIKL